MADQAHLTLIKQSVQQWNEWRRQHLNSRVKLSYANLSYANLSGANLSDANLSYANLSDANLSDANLSDANLSDANLTSVSLRDANLSRANLSGAILRYANFSDADLHRADLSGANLSGASLSGASLTDATMWETVLGNLDLRTVKGLETIRHEGPSHVSIQTVYRSEGDIPEVFMKGTGVPDSFIEYMHALAAKPIEYYTCFISYSSRDELFARRLHNDLQQEGVRCWFAPEDMDIGDKIKKRIDESIRLYDKLLLILSEHSIASNWVAYEVERALNKEPQGIPNVLYPVRLDNAIVSCTEEWASDIKSTRHIGNFEHWTDPQQYQDGLQRLLRALRGKQQREGKH